MPRTKKLETKDYFGLAAEQNMFPHKRPAGKKGKGLVEKPFDNFEDFQDRKLEGAYKNIKSKSFVRKLDRACNRK